MERNKIKNEIVYDTPCHICGCKNESNTGIFTFFEPLQNEVRKYNINGVFGEINICDECVSKIKFQII